MYGAAKHRSRPGQTEKISVSIDRKDLVALRRRARRLHGGNLSAAIAEGVTRLREEEGREALVAWLGEAGRTTDQQRSAILAEWSGAATAPQRAPRQKRR